MDDSDYVYLSRLATLDPRVKRLSAAATCDWFILVTLAARHGELIPLSAAVDALFQFRGYTPETTAKGFAEMERAELIALEPVELDGNEIRLLARGDLWALPGDLDGNGRGL